MDLITQSIIRLKVWNKSDKTRLERHEALKAILFSLAEDGTNEYPVRFKNGRRGRIDFVGDGYAVEIDHSMKKRSMAKLINAKGQGLTPVWIIVRGTNSYPRKYGRVKKMAEDQGIRVVCVKNLQKGYRA